MQNSQERWCSLSSLHFSALRNGCLVALTDLLSTSMHIEERQKGMSDAYNLISFRNLPLAHENGKH
jgi:hypothetical protein